MSETYLHVLGYVGEVSIRDRDGNKMTGVIRVGTVNPDGSVQAFTSVSDGRFKDRQNFVLQDEAAALPYGTFGFWHIVVEPNRKDPNKDYIKVTRPMGPPEAASGLTWPMAAPRDAPEKRPSVMSATVVSSFMPASALVGLSISRIPGPPLGPS